MNIHAIGVFPMVFVFYTRGNETTNVEYIME
jgi:hypothetical protein